MSLFGHLGVFGVFSVNIEEGPFGHRNQGIEESKDGSASDQLGNLRSPEVSAILYAKQASLYKPQGIPIAKLGWSIIF